MPQVSMEHREQIRAVLFASPLMPVITIHHPDDAVPLCRALFEGGLRVMEITLRTEFGVDAIRKVREELPGAWVGAGTVTSIAQYRQVEAAGAQFVITPGVTEAILDFGVTSEAPLLPGIATASELLMGYNHGYRYFKFFPAEVSGGIPALKAFSGPFPDVAFCPTGGIRQNTAADYLALQSVVTVGGTWLTPDDAVANKDWARITEIARASLASLKTG
ncbi:bifunctional 4-hydroxy-2-oxoglutarate aldolase/2-dehydro-3-deoxy-phosphogluconate aldolase [Marinobacter sp.]|uniref:bifunctional 4-hydroxy-2-oxoglutarate aldolase/2-dehydro-3-deoxy-phosphogluconate aldolase n=1 Tax=Marinobacter sp. TaxID=50741 RepID=UPI0019EE13B9|nr:bifunctional 4-hydroxy-2-oxoglutarate aldolase/2-dehydro-3-deoxy-phosphogluconate aldolase [Marinobacter sp.]MBE0484595.1 bifunctional 4-hydroxy-2-oxoglutarate aldolase/2-dehydro-3-deoxy-phosphogluconate aldolase [Marinobacter sp.]